MSRKSARRAAVVAVGCLAVTMLTATAVKAGSAQAAADRHPGANNQAFQRVATYPVFQNVPAGTDPALPTVAEISTVSADGSTLIYTDALGQRIGFLDISDPARPVGAGTLSLAQWGDAEDEPTSVATYGDYVLVVVNTSPNFTAPSGRLDVISLSNRKRVASLDLGGQPDSIAISKDKRYAAIAIENERDEQATPAGGDEGDLPQAPAGVVQIIDLVGGPTHWSARRVNLVQDNGSALPELVSAGIVEPTDPEPEYVTINSRNQLAVTLQENNGVVLIDLPTGKLTKAFSAGSATVGGIDTENDGTISLTGSITAPREPDSINWIDDRYLATANEGDWKGGTRGWSVFDARTGSVVWDAGNSFEYIAERAGLHDESRAGKKGTEPEGLLVANFRGKRYGFVGSERSNFVAVYDLTRPTAPRFLQVLAATNGPEGLLAIPSRGLLAVSSEEDDASVNVRASVSIFRFGPSAHSAGTPVFPSLVSDSVNGTPIGWGALGALSADPKRPNRLYTVADAAYSPTQILSIDTTRGRLSDPLIVTNDGAPVGLDVEGLSARPQGGFWLAVEGATGPGNKLVRTNSAGAVVETVALPTAVTSALGKQGLEGVTAITDRAGREQVWVALQRELSTDPKGIARLGRYDVRSKTWAFVGYRLEVPSSGADWIGLSEITAVDKDTIAVIERDKLNGPAAKIKRVYTVDIPAVIPADLAVLPKTLAVDVLPALRATKGWTQEKLEGLTISGTGRLFAITDNDGLSDATGETVFLDLGKAKKIFGK